MNLQKVSSNYISSASINYPKLVTQLPVAKEHNSSWVAEPTVKADNLSIGPTTNSPSLMWYKLRHSKDIYVLVRKNVHVYMNQLYY